MLSPIRWLRMAVMVVGLGSLALTLFPGQTEPLWSWVKTISGDAGKESLPSFGQTREFSGLALAGLFIGGMVYTLWRDRRFRALRMEYDYRTGATRLKEKVSDLESQLRRASSERDKWHECYLALTRQHAAALVTSKEHEVRSEYGRADRETLGEVRKELDALVRDKGHIEGFREAMQFFLAHLAGPEKRPGASGPIPAKGSSREQAGQEKRAALPFASPPGRNGRS